MLLAAAASLRSSLAASLLLCCFFSLLRVGAMTKPLNKPLRNLLDDSNLFLLD